MKNSLLLIISAFLCSCTSNHNYPGEGAIHYKNIEKHLAELSSDRYLGRRPISPAEGLTEGYIAREMAAIGLEPANNGSYFQEVPLLAVSSKISDTLRFDTPKGTLNLQKLTDLKHFPKYIVLQSYHLH